MYKSNVDVALDRTGGYTDFVFVISQCHWFHQICFLLFFFCLFFFHFFFRLPLLPLSSLLHLLLLITIILFSLLFISIFRFFSNSLSLYVSRISYYTTPFSPPIIPFKSRPTILCYSVREPIPIQAVLYI